ncbi:MAG: hypothetical protein Q9169_006882 [Polycauliona sp. 2 TL-2023]
MDMAGATDDSSHNTGQVSHPIEPNSSQAGPSTEMPSTQTDTSINLSKAVPTNSYPSPIEVGYKILKGEPRTAEFPTLNIDILRVSQSSTKVATLMAHKDAMKSYGRLLRKQVSRAESEGQQSQIPHNALNDWVENIKGLQNKATDWAIELEKLSYPRNVRESISGPTVEFIYTYSEDFAEVDAVRRNVLDDEGDLGRSRQMSEVLRYIGSAIERAPEDYC